MEGAVCHSHLISIEEPHSNRSWIPVGIRSIVGRDHVRNIDVLDASEHKSGALHMHGARLAGIVVEIAVGDLDIGDEVGGVAAVGAHSSHIEAARVHIVNGNAVERSCRNDVQSDAGTLATRSITNEFEVVNQDLVLAGDSRRGVDVDAAGLGGRDDGRGAGVERGEAKGIAHRTVRSTHGNGESGREGP